MTKDYLKGYEDALAVTRDEIEQKVVAVTYSDGAYGNFFAGGFNSIESHVRDGWLLKFLHDDVKAKTATAVFERKNRPN